jgi:hypothetical protein
VHLSMAFHRSLRGFTRKSEITLGTKLDITGYNVEPKTKFTLNDFVVRKLSSPRNQVTTTICKLFEYYLLKGFMFKQKFEHERERSF